MNNHIGGSLYLTARKVTCVRRGEIQPTSGKIEPSIGKLKNFQISNFFFVFFEFFQDFAMFGSISPGVVQMSPCVKVLYLLHIA